MDFKTIFCDIFIMNGLDIHLTEYNIEKFKCLTDIMLETNKTMNITAITEIDKIVSLHYSDCVKVAEHISHGAKVLDVGCGGGFPILPLAIVRPDLNITGLDSTDKKIKYVQHAADDLGLAIQTVSARAEELAKSQEHREKYDVVVGRAVARLNILSELCIPFVRIGGCFVAMKGFAGQSECDEAIRGIQKLGGSVSDFQEYDLFLMGEIEKRSLIRINKEGPTPAEYPRSFGSIKKKPL